MRAKEILLTKQCDERDDLDGFAWSRLVGSRSEVKRRRTKTHLIGQDARHALLADLVHPSQSLELVVSHGASDKALGLLGHDQLMLTESLAIK